jgi:voltage-gated potassium channel
MLREELRRVSGWQDHHRRLIARLLLILVATLVIDVVGTVLVYLAERHARGTDIKTLGDAFFFTTVQLLTVSSQIKNPFTAFGRAVDIVLEVWAVLVVAGSAGAVASFLQDVT